MVEASVHEVASALGCSPRRVHQLVHEGRAHRISRGKYDLVRTLQLELAHERCESEAARADRLVDPIEDLRARREEVRLRRDELRLQEAKRELISREHHLAVASKLAEIVKSTILSIPGSWATRVVGLKSQKRARRELRDASEELLDGLRSAVLEIIDP